MTSEASSSDHLHDAGLASYLDRRLTQEEQDRLEGHLAACRDCRTRLLAATTTLRSERRRSRLRVAAAASTAAIAGLLLAVPIVQERDAPRFREGEADAVSPIPPLQGMSPPDGSVVDRASVSFTWSVVESAARYRVTLTDPESNAVWVRDVEDTVVVFDVADSLVPGETYLWYVDALLPDGTSVTTGVLRFSVRP